MKIVDKIDAENKIEALTDSEREDFFTQMLTGKDVTGEVDERLDTETRPAAEQVSAPESVSAPADGGGVFAGLSSEPDNPKP